MPELLSAGGEGGGGGGGGGEGAKGGLRNHEAVEIVDADDGRVSKIVCLGGWIDDSQNTHSSHLVMINVPPNSPRYNPEDYATMFSLN